MDNEFETSMKIAEVEGRLKTIEVSLYIVFASIFSFVFLLDINSQLNIPHFRKLFEELFEGEPLPSITMFIFYTHTYFFILDFIFLGIVIFLLFAKKMKLLLPICTIFTIILLIKISITTTAMFAPLIAIIEKLGG